MTAKPEPIVPRCGTCDGNGGWWDHGNGTKKPKQWIKCNACDGTGEAPHE